jgi:ADP-heptose:LPS heptosyltransferase
MHGLPVVFANKETKHVFWSEVFENNHRIVEEPKNGQKVCIVENYPGKRPYIRAVTKERYLYDNGFCIEPGEIFLTDEEKAQGIEGAVLVEPHTKTEYGLSRNKAWPWERWQELVNTVNVPWVQMGPKGTRILEGVSHVETESFRSTLPYINKASLIVTTDGAIHHAAAALGKKAVVLWGGVASPDLLGYKTHKNICHEEHPCGSIVDCEHCVEAMKRITVDEVAGAVLDLLKR